MLVYRGFSQTAPTATVLTIGNFDGVHLGHRALLARLTAAAAKPGCRQRCSPSNRIRASSSPGNGAAAPVDAA
jgi:hypothetical protein